MTQKLSPNRRSAGSAPSDAELKKRVLELDLRQIAGLARQFESCVESSSPFEVGVAARLCAMSRDYRLNMRNGLDAEVARAQRYINEMEDLASSVGKESPFYHAFALMLGDPLHEHKLSAAFAKQTGSAEKRLTRVTCNIDHEVAGQHRGPVARYFLAMILRATPARALATEILQANDAVFALSLNLRGNRLQLEETWRDDGDAPLEILPRKPLRPGMAPPRMRDMAHRLGLPNLHPDTALRALESVCQMNDCVGSAPEFMLPLDLTLALLSDEAVEVFASRRPRSLATDPQGKVLPDSLVRKMRASLERLRENLAAFNPEELEQVRELAALLVEADAFDRDSRAQGTPWHQVAFLMAHYTKLGELQRQANRLCSAVDGALARVEAPPPVISPFTLEDFDEPAQATSQDVEGRAVKPLPSASGGRKRPNKAKLAQSVELPAARAEAVAAPSYAATAPGLQSAAAASEPADQEAWTHVSHRRTAGSSDGHAAPGEGRSCVGLGAKQATKPQALQASILQITRDLFMSAEEEHDSPVPGLPMSGIVRDLCVEPQPERVVRIRGALLKTCLSDADLTTLLTTCVHPGTFRSRNRSLLEAAAMSAAYHVHKHARGERIEDYLLRAFEAFDAHYCQEVTYRSDSPGQRAKLVRRTNLAGTYAWDHRLFWFDDRAQSA